jgi:hypothetical protein
MKRLIVTADMFLVYTQSEATCFSGKILAQGGLAGQQYGGVNSS